MNSKIMVGHTVHARFEPVAHRFKYPVFMFKIDCDELDQLNQNVMGFSWNKWNIWSLKDADYLMRDGNSIKNKVISILNQGECSEYPDKIIWYTSPKFFNYGFNPISIYHCLNAKGKTMAVLTEVHNTYKEGHIYLWKGQSDTNIQTFKIDKEFHVSPFFDEVGEYDFKLSAEDDAFSLSIQYSINNARIFYADLISHQMTPIKSKYLWQSLIQFPLAASLTMPRILLQAAKLYYIKKLPAKSKPIPKSEGTMRKLKPTIIQKLCISIFFKAFKHTKNGTVTCTGPQNETWQIGEGESTGIEINIRDYNFFKRTVMSGEIGLGESYQAGEWETNQLTEWISWIINNFSNISKKREGGQLWKRLENTIHHMRRANSKRVAKKNIEEHYCLSNRFYQLMLDPTMMYSSAVFPQADSDLESAQHEKVRRLIELGKVESHHHVLEIGTGWGTVAIELVKQTGCRVTTITLSKEQYNFANERIIEEGLSDKIDLKILDYRDLSDTYDRIFSIEMIEAVGHQYLSSFVQKLHQCCKPDGAVILQAICIPDQLYDQYKVSTDWIKKHIFPGGHLPSLHTLLELNKKYADFNLTHCFNIAGHYAKTLKCWHENVLDQVEEIKQEGFDDPFLNKWRYYLSYCEAAFKTRYLMTYQMVWSRPCNPKIS